MFMICPLQRVQEFNEQLPPKPLTALPSPSLPFVPFCSPASSTEIESWAAGTEWMVSEENRKAVMLPVNRMYSFSWVCDATHWTRTITGAVAATERSAVPVAALFPRSAFDHHFGCRQLCPGGRPNVNVSCNLETVEANVQVCALYYVIRVVFQNAMRVIAIELLVEGSQISSSLLV